MRQVKSTDPSLSKIAALRLLRDSGRACEQRRFGELVRRSRWSQHDREWLERKALEVLQNENTPLYLFALAAEEVDLVADVARIGRDEAGKLIGYQRPEKRKHVKQIQDYLDSADVLFPNGLILALPPEVRFKSSRGPGASDGLAIFGHAGDPAQHRT